MTTVIINKERYEVTGFTEISGAQIRALGGIDPETDIVIEDAGNDGFDLVIRNRDTIDLTSRATLRAFTRPPTSDG